MKKNEKEIILKLLNESSDFEDFKNKINQYNFNSNEEVDLIELRRNTTNRNEYQKLTYQINKKNKAEIINLNVYGNMRECISSKTFYINLLKYSKIPSEQFLFYFKGEITFISQNKDCDYCLLDSVIDLLYKACYNYYSKGELEMILKENNFDIFVTPADFMRIINVSSTKSLNIRIDKHNSSSSEKIIPFKLFINGHDKNAKILYLKSDINKIQRLLPSI